MYSYSLDLQLKSLAFEVMYVLKVSENSFVNPVLVHGHPAVQPLLDAQLVQMSG